MRTLPKQISISLLHRNHGMPYGDAARLLERLAQSGAISKPNGNGIRQVLTDEYRIALAGRTTH